MVLSFTENIPRVCQETNYDLNYLFLIGIFIFRGPHKGFLPP